MHHHIAGVINVVELEIFLIIQTLSAPKPSISKHFRIVMGILSGRLIETFLGLLTRCIQTRKVITQTMQQRLKPSLRHR
jgi:hypothetical protein